MIASLLTDHASRNGRPEKRGVLAGGQTRQACASR